MDEFCITKQYIYVPAHGYMVYMTVLVPARRSRAGASDSDGGGIDGVSSDILIVSIL